MIRIPRRSATAIKLVSAILLLSFVWHVAGGTEIFLRFGAADPVWLLAGLLITVPQSLLSAHRWRMVIEKLGGQIAFGRAASEYYVALFLNQILPGGVAGDVTRVVRHGADLRKRNEGQGYGFAAQAVVYERSIGQIAMIGMSIPGLALWRTEAAWIAAFVLIVVLIIALVAPDRTAVGRMIAGFRKAILGSDVVLIHVLVSTAIALSYVAVFWVCAQSISIDIPLGIAFMIFPPALLAMAIPITPAGWGLREAASIGLWIAAGLDPSDAAAVSILYGVLNLVGTLPGAIVLFAGRPTQP